MKKYLMGGIAAVAICAAFTSCSKSNELFDQNAAEQAKQQTSEQKIISDYQTAFENAFGKPASNQDWGLGQYGSINKAGTRAIEGFEKPGFSSKADIQKPSPLEQPSINNSGSNVTVIDGNTTLYNFQAGSTYYVNSGVTVTISGGEWGVSMQNVNFYLSSGSTLETNCTLSLEGSTNFVNDGGTIKIGNDTNKGNLTTNNLSGIFWNNGIVTISQNLSTSNVGGNLYNGSNGQITVGNVFLNQDVELWNEGTIELSGDFTTAANGNNQSHRIYNSGTLTTNKLSLNQYCTLYSEGGSITVTGTFECINTDDKIYIGPNSTLSVPSIELYNNNQLLVNEGTLDVEGAILARNSSAEIVNNGTLTAESVELKAGARMHNDEDGVATIAKLTKVTNTNTTWMNDGKYTSGDFEASDYAYDVWTNCKLTVTRTGTEGKGIFHLNRATFFVDGGASLITDYFYWEDTSNFYLGGKAIVDVKEELNTRNYNSGYGFRGMSNDYSVLRAKKITKHADVQFSLSCFGNIYVDCNDMFKQGAIDDSYVQVYYYFEKPNVKYGKEEDAPFSIEGSADGCNPGYNQNKKITYQGRIMGEDLTAMSDNDFDFNDVVFDWAISADKKTAYIKLLAAGGTLPLKIGTAVGQGEEVHALFGGVSTGTMVNTGVGADGITKEPVEFEITKTTGTFESAADIIVSVDKTSKGAAGYMQMTAKIGEAPCLLFVPLNTKWVDEYENIEKAYSWFGDWVKGAAAQWSNVTDEKYVDLILSNNN